MAKTHTAQAQSGLAHISGDFELFADALPLLVWVSDADGKYEYGNSHWFHYLDISKEKNTRQQWSNSIHTADREKVTQLWNHSVLTGEPFETEYRFLNGKTGEYRWFLARAKASRNNKGKVTKWFGSLTDIHEQKNILDSQTFLAEASKILSSSLNYVETLNQITSVAVPHIADWCSVELLESGQLIQISVAHKDPDKVQWAKKLSKKRVIDMSSEIGMPQVIRTGKSIFYPIVTNEMIEKAAKNKTELKLIKSLGFSSAMIVPITIEGKTIGVIQFVTTESKKRFDQFNLYTAEELGRRAALAIQNAQLYENAQRKEKQFRALYESNIIGVLYTNLEGQVSDANEAFLQMIGYTKEDLEAGRIRWDRLTPAEYQTESKQALREILSEGAVTPWEKEYIKKDGSQVPVIIGSVLLNKNTNQILTFVLDITERKKLEQRKDEFISIASHELKTPLTSIKGYVQILERIVQQMGDEKLNSYIQKTNTYIDRLNSLIVDLLDVSKIQSGKLSLDVSSFKVQALLDEVLEGVQQTNSSYNIIQPSHTDTMIQGDKHRLEQVFTNLLTNAIKYSPRNKKIILSVEKLENDIQVSVQDFGIGISKKEQSKVFDRFYRSDSVAKRFSGLGIGLYISYEIVERHGGKMWVESVAGKGSTFFFSLPIKQKALS